MIQKDFYQLGIHLARAVVMVGILWNIPTFAQTALTRTIASRSSLTMTQVELSAEEAALIPEGLRAVPLYAPESLPFSGTFYSLQITNYPPFPGNIFNLPCWSLGDGVFLLNDVSVDYQALRQQAEAERAASRSMMNSSGPPGPGEGGGEGGGGYSEFQGQVFTTNDLWLEIAGVNSSNQTASLVIHPPWNETNAVYDLFMTTNLTVEGTGLNRTNWAWVVRTGTWQTNLTVGGLTNETTFFRLGLTNDTDGDWLTDAFEKLVGHTDPNNGDQNTNGLPDGWEWKYFGNLNQTASGDYDGDGVDNGTEYTNGTDPNTIQFTAHFGYGYSASTTATGTVDVITGVPAQIATLVDTNDFSAAQWQSYSSNFVAILPAVEGRHGVWVGLRGRAEDSPPIWVSYSVVLDQTPPPILSLTPAPGVTGKPFVQISGQTTEDLWDVSCTVSNAAGVGTNFSSHPGVRQDFKVLDVELTNGLNSVSVAIADYAGNTTTTNFTLTLDLPGDTNAPAVAVIWPADGAQIGTEAFTLRGQMDDETAVVTAQAFGTNGVTNLFAGLVERNGAVWVDDIPLAAGTNWITLTAMDAAGNVTVTNLTVIRSVVTLTMNTVPEEQLHQPTVNVSGTIGASGYKVWVNGIAATMSSTNWTADNVPVSPGGMAVFAVTAIPLADNGGNGTPPASQNNNPALNNPTGTNALNAAQQGEKQAEKVRVSEQWTYHLEGHDLISNHSGAMDAEWNCTESNQWASVVSGVGGLWFTNDETGYVIESGTNRQTGTNGIYYGFTATAVIDVGLVGYWNMTVPIMDWLKGGWNWKTNTPDFEAKANGVADTRVVLRTGGRSGVKRQSLFMVTETVADLAWLMTGQPALPVLPEQVYIPGLKKHLGADGKAWAALADNDEVPITPIAPVAYYSFTADKQKYHLYIGLSTSTTNANLDTVVPEVCVGQSVIMGADWEGGSGPAADADIRWHLPEKYVNEQYQYSSTCTSYRKNADALTNAAIQCWYVNLPGGACSVREILHFSNGQYVTIVAAGNFTVYRPQKTNENMSEDLFNLNLGTPSPPLYATNVNGYLNLGDSQGGYARFWAAYYSSYSGEFREAQIVQSYRKAGNDDPVDSGSQWWNDHASNIAGSLSMVSPGGGVAFAMQTDKYPRLPLKTPQTVVNDVFKTYFQFKPAGDGIWVTMGRVNWSWAATSTYTNGLWNPPSGTSVSNPQYHDDDSFPLWDGEHL